jgi:hypothetical protein
VETHDSGRKVYLLLAVGALVVTLCGVFAGMGDKYFAARSDSRTASLRTPREGGYNFPYGSLAFAVDPVRYLHLDLRKPGLQTAVCQERLCLEVWESIARTNTRRAALQDRWERLDLLSAVNRESIPALAEPDS